MTATNRKNFFQSSTPDGLKQILRESLFDFDLFEIFSEEAALRLKRIYRSVDKSLSNEVRRGAPNERLFCHLFNEANASIEIGHEIQRNIMLWLGRHELGSAAETVEQFTKPRFGVMGVVDGELTVMTSVERRREPVEVGRARQQAEQILLGLRW